MDSYDILIAGAGPVGASLALALADCAYRVALVAPAERGGSAGTPHDLARPIALAHASRDLLRRLGAITADAGTPIATIHVSQRGGFGRTVMHAADHGLDALGYVFDGAVLERTIAAAASASRVVAQLIDWSVTPDGVDVRLETTSVVRDARARLLVLAEGGAHGTAEIVRDYGQSALVGTIRTTEPHRHTAWERFTPDGPLALLPLRDRYAFVWALPNAVAQGHLHADESRFCAALQSAFGDRQGRFFEAGPRACMPLTLKRTQTVPEPGVIPIGNAAQTLHPVAGQGLNLGLRDVVELADMITSAPLTEIGTHSFAQAFGRHRWLDRSTTIAATDLFVRVFSSDQALISALRGTALGVLDVFPPARRFLAQRMMLGARTFR